MNRDRDCLIRLLDATPSTTAERTAQEVTDLQERFPLLPNTAAIFTPWLGLGKRLPIHGKRVHDARLVAVLQAHGVQHLITFNASDFATFPALSLVDPKSLAEPLPA